jgi:hypothetical protein
VSDCLHLVWAWAHPYAPEGSDISWVCEECGLEAAQKQFDERFPPLGYTEQLSLWEASQ